MDFLRVIASILICWTVAAIQGASFGIVVGYFLWVIADAIRDKRRFEMSEINDKLDEVLANEATEADRLAAIEVAVADLKASGVDVSKIEAILGKQADVAATTTAIEDDINPPVESSSSSTPAESSSTPV